MERKPLPTRTSSMAQLAYAPARPWRRPLRMIRRTLLLVIILAGGSFVWWQHKPLAAHAQLLYCQYRCETHADSATAVVASVGPLGKITSSPIPAFWTFCESASAIAPRGNAGGRFRPLPVFTPTLAFLHRRRSRGGHDRIVAVQCIPVYLSSFSVLQAFQPAVIEPAGWWPLTSRPIIHESKINGGFPIDVPVKAFAGQPDPADPTHFTIAYTVRKQAGIVDGWLGDDDTVKLKVRAGSADVYPHRSQ
jgi:hypothetical protein